MPILDLVFNLAWLIPAFPFLAFLVVATFAHSNRVLSRRLAVGGISITFLLSQIVFWAAVSLPVGGGERAFESALVPWLSTGLEVFSFSVTVDPVSATMLFMVPLTCLLIFVYGARYTDGDPDTSRFFACLSLLAAGMLGMVVFNNLLTFFISWEVVGACAYLLISFRHQRLSAARAALKTFLVTQVGDVFFLLGLLLLYSEVGSLAYRDIFNPETLESLAHTPLLATPFSTVTVVGLLLFVGTVGKSAQFPLHIWASDAVEAPTPASALIYAITTVPAGAFLVVRCFPLLAGAAGGLPMTTAAVIGALTALFSSIVALAQRDIRRALALSAIGQMGYVIAGLGIGAFVAGTFHLITYMAFQALLFLGADAVVHSMEHRHRREASEKTPHQASFSPSDMANMGGLARRMPRTFWTFLIGSMALSGFPLVTAGFWSRDQILAQANESWPLIFWMLAATAGLIAFHAMRQVCLVFLGQPRTDAAEHGSEDGPSMTVPLIVLAALSVGLGWIGIPDRFPIFGGWIPNWFQHFVSPKVEMSLAAELTAEAPRGFAWQHLMVEALFTLGGLALGWLVYGWKPMQAGDVDRVEAGMRRVWLGWLYDAMYHRFYLGELYQATLMRGAILLGELCKGFDQRVVDGAVNLVGRAGQAMSRISDRFDTQAVDRLVNLVGLGTQALSNLSSFFDRQVVDGAAEGVGEVVGAGGRFIRPIQTGRVQNYLLMACLMVLALVVAFFTILLLQI